MKADKTQEVLRRELTNAVLHPHGWWEEPESVVLGLTSYLTVKDDPHAKAVLDSLTMEHVLHELGSISDKVVDRLKALVHFNLSFSYQHRDNEQRVTADAIRTRAVSMLAMVWRDAQADRAYLKALAQSDQDSGVRSTALRDWPAAGKMTLNR